jgi:hypothetical protein
VCAPLVSPWLHLPFSPPFLPTISTNLNHRLERPSNGVPLPVSCTFPPPPLRYHCTVMPPSLSRHEMPARSPSKLPDTALSSTQTLGATSTSLPAPSAAPLLHHRRSSPAELSHRGVIPHSEIAGTKPLYVCPGCFIYTYSNNMINRFHVQ